MKDAIGSVFDGELVRLSKNKDDILHYLIFDCYYENGKDIRMKSLNTRISVANKLISSKEIDDSTEFIIKVKSFFYLVTNFIVMYIRHLKKWIMTFTIRMV